MTRVSTLSELLQNSKRVVSQPKDPNDRTPPKRVLPLSSLPAVPASLMPKVIDLTQNSPTRVPNVRRRQWATPMSDTEDIHDVNGIGPLRHSRFLKRKRIESSPIDVPSSPEEPESIAPQATISQRGPSKMALRHARKRLTTTAEPIVISSDSSDDNTKTRSIRYV